MNMEDGMPEHKIRKAVITAAGLGTRFFPISNTVPKEMFPIFNKPIIQHIVEEAYLSGIEQILIIINKSKTLLVEYFDIPSNFEEIKKLIDETIVHEFEKIGNYRQIYFLRQAKSKGLGDAVLMAKEFVGNEPFLLMLGDVIMENGPEFIKELTQVYRETNCSVIGVSPVDEDMISNVGIVELTQQNDNYANVRSIIEKPRLEEARSNISIIGRYILNSEIFEHLEFFERESQRELDLSPALDALSRSGQLKAVLYNNFYMDTGTPINFILANLHFAMKDPILHQKIKNKLLKYKF
jgi:UTP--glucose-1-phosphate uridylyltransferase